MYKFIWHEIKTNMSKRNKILKIKQEMQTVKKKKKL